MQFNTRLLRGKEVNRYSFGGTLPGIDQSSAFGCKTAKELEAIFNGRGPGFSYTRVSNPTVDAFERRICELEGGLQAVACSSGMAAVSSAIMNLVTSGDEIIVSSALFGGTIEFLHDLSLLGVKVHYVRHLDAQSLNALLNDKTRAVFCELIANPSLDVADLETIAKAAHAHNVPLIVDSTTATPYLIQPFKFGADIVVHSASKYINGSGCSISGIIIDSGKFPWDFDKFKALSEYRKFRKFAYVARLRTTLWRNLGGCLAPFNAFLNVLGLETLGLRMQRICENTLALAKAMREVPGISVNYPGLEDNPYYPLVKKQFNGLGGGILTLRAGSKEKAFKLMDNLKCATIATNIGDIRTLVIYPRSTIFNHSTEEQAAAAGVYDDTIRVSVGIEDAADLISDFKQAAAIAQQEE